MLSVLSLVLAASDPRAHVVQHPLVEVGGVTILSNHIIMMVLAGLLIIWLLPAWSRRRAGTDEVGRHVPTGFGNALEFLCDALRTNVFRPQLGAHTDTFTPYLWSVFFFILAMNLLGMIPLGDWTPFLGGGHVLGGTATGNLWVTSTLAIITLVLIVYNGLRVNGMDYIKHFFIGPPGLNVFIAVLEFIGLLAKTFALAMRLFANMIAGHIVLAMLLSFVGAAYAASGLGASIAIAVPVIASSVALNFLELFVAFLQAFIFTFLTAVFIGQAVNIHHDDHHDDEHGHAGEPGATHAAH